MDQTRASGFKSSADLKGVVPSICDAEAGHEQRLASASLTVALKPGDPHSGRLRSIVAQLCAALRAALNDEHEAIEDRLKRADDILTELSEPPPRPDIAPGGLSPWQVRKVIEYIEANLDRTIRNEELAALARLTSAHFGRAFRNSVGEPPHEYLIRRRIERAQSLMLSTRASLSEIALNCGLADQSHLTRLFRRLVGESPSAWRRARITE